MSASNDSVISDIAKEFITCYYTTLNDEKQKMHKLYTASSIFSFTESHPVHGSAEIQKAFDDLNGQIKVNLADGSVDALGNQKNIEILLRGIMYLDHKCYMYSQAVNLVQPEDSDSYFILFDIIRLSESAENKTVSIGVSTKTPAKVTPQPPPPPTTTPTTTTTTTTTTEKASTPAESPKRENKPNSPKKNEKPKEEVKQTTPTVTPADTVVKTSIKKVEKLPQQQPVKKEEEKGKSSSLSSSPESLPESPVTPSTYAGIVKGADSKTTTSTTTTTTTTTTASTSGEGKQKPIRNRRGGRGNGKTRKDKDNSTSNNNNNNTNTVEYKPHNVNTTVVIKQLPITASEEILRNIVKGYGDIKIIDMNRTAKGSIIAFIEFYLESSKHNILDFTEGKIMVEGVECLVHNYYPYYTGNRHGGRGGKN